MYVGIDRSAVCPMVIWVSVRLEVRCPQYVVAFSVDLQQVIHVVKVFLKWQHQCNLWCVWRVIIGSVWSHEGLQTLT